MKVWQTISGLILITHACFAQGQIGQVLFANRGPGFDAPFIVMPFYAGDPIVGPGEGWTAQLNLYNNSGSVTPLLPVSTFFPAGTGGDPRSDEYWRPQIVDIPGAAPGSAATLIVRFWETSQGTYESASFKGQSAPFTITVGGGLIPPASLTTLQSTAFALIPEPPALALLAFFGLAPLVFGRMRGERS